MPVSWTLYRRFIAYFLDPLQETIACFLDFRVLAITVPEQSQKCCGGASENPMGDRVKAVSWYLGYRTFLEENPDIFK